MPQTFTNKELGVTVTWNGDGDPTDEQLDALFSAAPEVEGKRRQDATNARAAEYAQRDAKTAEEQALARANEARLARTLEWAGAKTPTDRLAVMASAAVPVVSEMLTSAGIVGGLTGIGEAAGGRVAGPVGKKVGGAAGATLGSVIEEVLKQAEDPNRKVAYGEAVGNVISGVLQTQGQKRNAALNAGIETIRSLIDERQLPSPEGVARAAAMGYVAGQVAQKLTGKSLSPRDQLMEYRYNAFRELRDEGVVVNPALLGQGSPAITAMAGAEPLNTVTSQRNQFVWQKLAREELGLGKEALPFRPDVRNELTAALEKDGEIKEAIKKAGKPYEDVRALSEDAVKELEAFKAGKPSNNFWVGKTPEEMSAILGASDNLNNLKKVREEIKDLGKEMKSNPEAYEKYKAAKLVEDQLEAQIDLAASSMGNKKLKDELIQARGKLARIYAIEEATDSFGVVNVNVLADNRQTNSRPGRLLTGNLKKMADFAEAFGANAQDATQAATFHQQGTPVNFVARQTAMGNAAGPVSMGVPVLRDAARNYILDDKRQNRYMSPVSVPNQEQAPSMAVRQFLGALGREHPDQGSPDLNFNFKL